MRSPSELRQCDPDRCEFTNSILQELKPYKNSLDCIMAIERLKPWVPVPVDAKQIYTALSLCLQNRLPQNWILPRILSDQENLLGVYPIFPMFGMILRISLLEDLHMSHIIQQYHRTGTRNDQSCST